MVFRVPVAGTSALPMFIEKLTLKGTAAINGTEIYHEELGDGPAFLVVGREQLGTGDTREHEFRMARPQHGDVRPPDQPWRLFHAVQRQGIRDLTMTKAVAEAAEAQYWDALADDEFERYEREQQKAPEDRGALRGKQRHRHGGEPAAGMVKARAALLRQAKSN